MISLAIKILNSALCELTVFCELISTFGVMKDKLLTFSRISNTIHNLLPGKALFDDADKWNAIAL